MFDELNGKAMESFLVEHVMVATLTVVIIETIDKEVVIDVEAVMEVEDVEEIAMMTVVTVATIRMTTTTTIIIAVGIIFILKPGELSLQSNVKLSSMPAVLPTLPNETTTTIIDSLFLRGCSSLATIPINQ